LEQISSRMGITPGNVTLIAHLQVALGA